MQRGILGQERSNLLRPPREETILQRPPCEETHQRNDRKPLGVAEEEGGRPDRPRRLYWEGGLLRGVLLLH